MLQVLVDILFILLVLLCSVLILRTVSAAWRGDTGRGRAFALAAVSLFLWLSLTAGLALSGLLEPSVDHPPPNGALLVIVLATVCVIAFGPIGRRIIQRIAAHKLIAFQVFRIPVELILWALAINGVGPEIMTFEGRNFDILVGLSALPMAILIRKNPNKSLIIGWNIAGMAILGVVLIHAVLAGPSPFQKFFVAPDTSFVATWPYVWLPGLLVPLAYAGHLLSIRHALTTSQHSSTAKQLKPA